MIFRICVVIPVYNHDQAIRAIIEKIKKCGLPCIIVDDGSQKKTQEVLNGLEDLDSEIRLVRFKRNRGKGAAVMEGCRLASDKGFSHALQIDADGQHCIEDIPKFVEVARHNPTCLVTGKPIFDDSIPKGRLVGRYLTHFWVWIETLSLQIGDSMCGFRVYPLEATVPLLDQASIGTRMDFDTEVMVRLFWDNVPVKSIPTVVRYPKNNVSHFNLALDNILISWMHTRLVFGMLRRLPQIIAQRMGRRNWDSGHWGLKRERGSYLGMQVLLLVYRTMGITFARLMLYPIIGYFFLTDRCARAASLAFLQRIYTAQSNYSYFSHKPTWKDSFKHFFNFGDSVLDKCTSWMGQIDPERVVFPNRERLMECIEAKTGGLILTSHLGNIEICRVLADQIEHLRMNVLVDTDNARRFNRLLKNINPRVELDLIEVQTIGPEFAVSLKNRIEQGEWLSLAADRTSTKFPKRVVNSDFLGRKAPFPQGPFVLAGLLDCPVFLMFCLKRHGQYHIHFEQFEDSLVFDRKQRNEKLQEAVRRYASRLEHYALRYPLQWFNFHDFWHPV